MKVRPVVNKTYPFTNEELRAVLSLDCRKALMDIVRDNVRLCMQNNSVDDAICQSMAKDANEMEDFLFFSNPRFFEEMM